MQNRHAFVTMAEKVGPGGSWAKAGSDHASYTWWVSPSAAGLTLIGTKLALAEFNIQEADIEKGQPLLRSVSVPVWPKGLTAPGAIRQWWRQLSGCAVQRPLLGVKRTWRGLVGMSANDP